VAHLHDAFDVLVGVDVDVGGADEGPSAMAVLLLLVQL
jgi:hypothetical protein